MKEVFTFVLSEKVKFQKSRGVFSKNWQSLFPSYWVSLTTLPTEQLFRNFYVYLAGPLEIQIWVQCKYLKDCCVDLQLIALCDQNASNLEAHAGQHSPLISSAKTQKCFNGKPNVYSCSEFQNKTVPPTRSTLYECNQQDSNLDTSDSTCVRDMDSSKLPILEDRTNHFLKWVANQHDI